MMKWDHFHPPSSRILKFQCDEAVQCVCLGSYPAMSIAVFFVWAYKLNVALFFFHNK